MKCLVLSTSKDTKINNIWIKGREEDQVIIESKWTCELTGVSYSTATLPV